MKVIAAALSEDFFGLLKRTKFIASKRAFYWLCYHNDEGGAVNLLVKTSLFFFQ